MAGNNRGLAMALTPGLQDTFKVHAEESAKLHAFRQNLLEAGLKSGSVDDSVIKTGAAVTKDVQGSLAEQAEKQAKQRADDIMFLALLDSLDAQIAENNNKIADNVERIRVLDEQINVLETALEKIERGEALDLNEDGSFADEELEAAVRAFEDEYGTIFDRENPDPKLLKEVLEVARQEKIRLEGENIALERENEVLEAERDAALAMVKDDPDGLVEIAKDRFSSEEQERILERGLNEYSDSEYLKVLEARNLQQEAKTEVFSHVETDDELFFNSGGSLAAEFGSASFENDGVVPETKDLESVSVKPINPGMG